jgi:phospholipid transport system substrate-binding protein
MTFTRGTISKRDFLVGGFLLMGAAMLPQIARAQAAAPAGADAGAFVQGLGDKAIAQLSGSKVSLDQLQARFREILEGSFDVPRIGAFTAGPYWRTASDDQKKEFLGLFESQIVNAYAKRFQAYSGQKFKVAGSRKEGENDNIVDSQILQPNGGPAVNVQWRVRQEPAGLKVVDVTIEGISMSVTQRQEYAAVIERGGGNFQALLTALKTQSAPVAAPPTKG